MVFDWCVAVHTEGEIVAITTVCLTTIVARLSTCLGGFCGQNYETIVAPFADQIPFDLVPRLRHHSYVQARGKHLGERGEGDGSPKGPRGTSALKWGESTCDGVALW